MFPFLDDLPPETVNDADAAREAMAERIVDYLTARAKLPAGVDPPTVELAGAVVGLVPLRTAVSAISMAMPSPEAPEYNPTTEGLAGFAAAVEAARRRVYDYAEKCWGTRRAVLVDCGRRAADLTPDHLDHTAALHDCRIVVAEAAHAEQRLAVFESGIRATIDLAEGAAQRGDTARIATLTNAVAAAGWRHSAPSEALSSEATEGQP